jgi:Domain of unknown function (DUF4263)
MTKEFQKVLFDPDQCRREALQLRDFLAAHRTLGERKHILPFFKARLQLSAYLVSYHPDIVGFDLVAHELPLFGDFVADLVAGDSRTSAFAFIEFEDAAPDSIFLKKRQKATPDWAPRFEAGFSQLVDWFFKLHDQANTIEFEHKFGSRTIRQLGLLVVGRTETLGKREEHRLRWRQEHVLINSRQVHCKTFDQLCEDILARLERFPRAVRVEEKATEAGKSKTSKTGKKTPKRGKPGQ